MPRTNENSKNKKLPNKWKQHCIYKTRMFEKQKGLLEVTKLEAEISSRKLKENIEEISQMEQNQKTGEWRESGQ